MRASEQTRALRRERDLRRTPALAAVLGYGPFLPLLAGAGWEAARFPFRAGVLLLALAWGGAILCFLAGVRRGLSFDTPGGAALAELGSMLWLFVLGVTALALTPWRQSAALGLLVAGYASAGVLDALAARDGEAPRYFARLRPAQAVLAVASLAILLIVS